MHCRSITFFYRYGVSVREKQKALNAILSDTEVSGVPSLDVLEFDVTRSPAF
jgi:hypothetical protein